MSIAVDLRQRTAALRRAAVRATLAPSVHNTQPWRFDLTENELSLSADPTRQLQVLDPTRRQLIISCGCALLNARVSLASLGLEARVDRFPDPAQPDLLALISTREILGGRVDPLAALNDVIELRHTNRRRFGVDEVPEHVIDDLQGAAAVEDSMLFVVRSEQHRLAVAALSQQADAAQNMDPAYRAEIRAWTTSSSQRRDGVPAAAVPHVNGQAQDEIPIRDFDSSGTGWLPAQTRSSHTQCLLLLCTQGDTPRNWLRAGEALERVLLEITRHGLVASPLTQVVEVGWTRAALRGELGMTGYPHVLLRVGRAPATPASRRRRLVQVLHERP